MDEELSDPGSAVPSKIQTEATKKQLLSPYHDTSIANAHENVAVYCPKRKCGKKIRRKSGGKKHRAGKNRKRKWKPYFRLTAAERRKLDERNEKRNFRRHSVCMAPPNSTQFLLADRSKTRDLSKKFDGGDNSDQSSLSEYDGSDSELSDEFNAMWMQEYDQRFQKMDRNQLVQRYLTLEDQIEWAEESRNEEITKIQIYQDEVKRYEIAIEELQKLNAGLTKMIDNMPCSAEKNMDKKEQTSENDIFSVDTGPAV